MKLILHNLALYCEWRRCFSNKKPFSWAKRKAHLTRKRLVTKVTSPFLPISWKIDLLQSSKISSIFFPQNQRNTHQKYLLLRPASQSDKEKLHWLARNFRAACLGRNWLFSSFKWWSFLFFVSEDRQLGHLFREIDLAPESGQNRLTEIGYFQLKFLEITSTHFICSKMQVVSSNFTHSAK